jgi:hypothetical protein
MHIFKNYVYLRLILIQKAFARTPSNFILKTLSHLCCKAFSSVLSLPIEQEPGFPYQQLYSDSTPAIWSPTSKVGILKHKPFKLSNFRIDLNFSYIEISNNMKTTGVSTILPNRPFLFTQSSFVYFAKQKRRQIPKILSKNLTIPEQFRRSPTPLT